MKFKEKMEKKSYKKSVDRLEEIISLLDSDQLDIDELSELLKEANELVSFCNKKLLSTSEEIEKIRKESELSEE